jgi:hypothetical protein
VRQFNDDQTVAAKDPANSISMAWLLGETTDSWYSLQSQYFQQLKDANLYEIQEERSFDVLSSEVSGDTATVVTQETWYTRKYDRMTDVCQYHQPEYTRIFTYTLVYRNHTWLISHMGVDKKVPNDVKGC